ncbi:MAG: SRPBCC family protein [Proteobacteria bacterium]|nr:SRPBCC family protein [Pseudomonadota bacterium]
MQIDVAEAVGAVVRKVEIRDHAGQPVRVVIASRAYETGVEDLWNAITDAERIPRWFAPVSGELRLGGRYQIQGNAAGTITDCEPPRRFAATWEFGGGMSWLSVTLEAEGAERARLTLEHMAPVDPHWGQYGAGAVGVGWDLTLVGLGQHLAGSMGGAESGMAWAGSDEGKAFMRRCATGWGEAEAAAGEDPAVARSRAKATAKFYTGG